MTTAHGKIYVAGHRGLVGSAIWRALEAQGAGELVGRPSSELDLRDRPAVFEYLESERPQTMVMAAARVGGILANSTRPVEFLSDNLLIQTNLLDAAHAADVGRVIFLGSSCIYPRMAPQPIPEDSLLTGPLEPTNDAYAIAKIAGIKLVQSYRRQHGRSWVSVMPSNLYGPGDNFDLETSHVLPALIRKAIEAVDGGADHLELWGTGAPRREFLHVDDLASAVLFILDHYDDDMPVNVGVGEDISIRELATKIAEVVGFDGEFRWDDTKPDGVPRKLLDVSRLFALGWRPTITLEEGLRQTVDWYRDSVARDEPR